jgi:hypothetical protein
VRRGLFTALDNGLRAAVGRAQATADNARQMVLNRDKVLADLDADTATLGDAIAAAGTEHTNMRAEWDAGDADLSHRIDEISLTPGPAGKDGTPGAAGRDGHDGRDGLDGSPGKDGRDGTSGQPGKDGSNGSNGQDGLSAYQVARASGYGGTQAQWLATLVGPKGDTGAAGTNNLQIEYRDGVPVPAITSLLGISAQVDVTIPWVNALPDNNYFVTPQINTAAPALIGKTSVTTKSKTAAGCVVTVTTTALVSTGQATLSAVAYRKG